MKKNAELKGFVLVWFFFHLYLTVVSEVFFGSDNCLLCKASHFIMRA